MAPRTSLQLLSFLEVVFGMYNLYFRTQQRSNLDPNSTAGFVVGGVSVLYGQWLWITSLKMKEGDYKVPTASLMFMKVVLMAMVLLMFITTLEARHTTILTQILLVSYGVAGFPFLAVIHSSSRGAGKGTGDKARQAELSSEEVAAMHGGAPQSQVPYSMPPSSAMPYDGGYGGPPPYGDPYMQQGPPAFLQMQAGVAPPR